MLPIPSDRAQPEPLVLLPGTLCDERLFAPLVARLKGIATIVGDMSLAASTPALARALLARLPARFALLGFSLGGIVALEMVAAAPDRVTRLALLDTTPREDPVENALLRRNTVMDARREGIDGFITAKWEQLVSPVNRGSAALRETILAMARQGGVDCLASQVEVAIDRADSRPRLSKITVPTLVLAGEHEQVTPIGHQREIADGIRGAEFFLIPDAGHFAPLENPDAVAHHIDIWLRRPALAQLQEKTEETA